MLCQTQVSAQKGRIGGLHAKHEGKANLTGWHKHCFTLTFDETSRGRAADFLGACVALPAAKNVSWWSAINVTQKKTIHPSISASTLLLLSVLQGCWSQRWGYTLDQSEHRRTNDHPTQINTWKLHTGSTRDGITSTTFLFWGDSINKGTNTTTQSAQ